jgi:DNA-binding IclR family transcriptional regulator
MTEKSGAQTFERGLDILWHFVESENGYATIGDIVKTFGISRSTAYRLVKILRDRHILEEAEVEGAYRLGFRVLQLASGLDQHQLLRQVMLPYMNRLAKLTQETVILTVKYGTQALCIERIRSPQSINFTFEKSRLMPLHAGASAKILLAYSTHVEQEQIFSTEFTVYTSTTPATHQWLQRDLMEIRRLGYAITYSEVDPDSTSISVPLLGPRHELVAGLSVGGPSFRITPERERMILPALQDVAAEFTAKEFSDALQTSRVANDVSSFG